MIIMAPELLIGRHRMNFQDPITETHLARGIDLAREPDFQLGDMRVSPSARTIEHAQEKAILEPKVMSVLVLLAHGEGDFFTKDELVEACWDGRIVGDSAITRVLSLLRKSLAEIGDGSIRIENRRAVGYRLVTGGSQETAAARQPFPARSRWPILALAIAAIMALGAWLLLPADTDERSLVVLSVNSEDSEERLLASGIAADIGSSLNSIEGLAVRSARSAQVLQGRAVAPAEIGRKLGADLVLTSRLSRKGEKYLLEYSLVDTRAGTVVLSRTEQSSRQFLHSLPGRAASSISQALDLAAPARETLALTDPADAELLFAASALMHTRDGEQIQQAVGILRKLMSRNPEFAQGWSLLAKSLRLAPAESLTQRQQMTAEAEKLAARAMRMQPDSPEVLKVYGLLAAEPAERLAALERSARLAPLDAETWLWLANARLHDPAASELEAMQRLIELEPLWNRAWQATNTAASYGDLDLADEMDDLVISAADEKWQSEFAQARKAKRHGELALSYTLGRSAVKNADPAGRQLLTHNLKLVPLLLEIEPFHDARVGSASVGSRIATGHLPTQRDLMEAGISETTLFELGPALASLLPLLVRKGREDFVVSAYDASFGEPRQFAAAMGARTNGDMWLAYTAAYLGWSLRQTGREREAAMIFRLGEQAAENHVKAGAKSVRLDYLIAAASLQAAQGAEGEAADLMRRAANQGWPYSDQDARPAIGGPLTDDPVFAKVKEHELFKPALDKIRTNIALQKRAYRARHAEPDRFSYSTTSR